MGMVSNIGYREGCLVSDDDVVTYRVYEPAFGKSVGTVVWVGGFAQGARSYGGEITRLVEKGYRVLWAHPTKGVALTQPALKVRQQYPAIEMCMLRKASAVQKVLLCECDALSQVTVVGHSQGAIVSALLASFEPSMITRLIAVCPAGLYHRQDSVFSVLMRFMHDKMQLSLRADKKSVRAKAQRISRSFLHEVMRDIGFRWRSEIPAIVYTNMTTLLQHIRQQELCEIVLVTAVSDKVFPPTLLTPATHDDPCRTLVHRWVNYVEYGASHTAPCLEVPGLIAQLIET